MRKGEHCAAKPCNLALSFWPESGMTVQNTTSKIRYTGNGATVAFSFPFKVFAAGDLDVYLVLISSGAQTLQTITTHYTVSINRNSDGGTVTFVTAPSALYEVLIKRNLDRTQSTDLPAVSNFPEESIENALDKLTMITSEIDEILNRCPKFAETSEFEGVTFPELVANKYIKCNAAGTGLETGTPIVTTTAYPGAFTYGTDAAKPASPTSGDIYFASDTNKFYKCISSGTWTTAMNFADLVAFSAAALNLAKGSDIASATTCDIGAATGNFVHITGTTTITGLGTVQAGTHRMVRFAGALILTHNATSLILPGGANITTAAGDTAIFVSEGSGNWRCILYQKASGVPIASQAISSAFKNLVVTCAANNTAVLTADEFFVTDSNGVSQKLTSLNMTPDKSTAGPAELGRDQSGAFSNSTWCYLWVIAKADGTKSAIWSASATAPTLPTGYTFKGRASAWFIDSGGNFIQGKQVGIHVQWADLRVGASGDTNNAFVAVDMTNFIPLALSNRVFGKTYPSTATGNTIIANRTTGNYVFYQSPASLQSMMFYFEMSLEHATNLQWLSDDANSAIHFTGFLLDKL